MRPADPDPGQLRPDALHPAEPALARADTPTIPCSAPQLARGEQWVPCLRRFFATTLITNHADPMDIQRALRRTHRFRSRWRPTSTAGTIGNRADLGPTILTTRLPYSEAVKVEPRGLEPLTADLGHIGPHTPSELVSDVSGRRRLSSFDVGHLGPMWAR